VQRARQALPEEIISDVVLAADSCDDNTVAVAREILGDSGVVVETSTGVVGCVRALAAKTALNRFQGSLSRMWLANTDADCEVPADWLLRHLEAAQSGFAASAGIVDVDSFEEHSPWVERLFRLTYLIHADGTHSHVHGANLGVRADAYLSAGGWSDLKTGEDHNLWRRLRIGGHTLRSDTGLEVLTSGRRVGRAPSGFAEALSAHNEAA
jgi:hypothetical protein